VELFGISPQELLLIVVVAVIVFGQRLPQVAGEAAATVQKLRRALSDLRRESGIDQELQNARREIDQNVVRPFRDADLAGTIEREARAARTELQPTPETESATSATSEASPAPPPDLRGDDAAAGALKAPDPAERSDPRPG